MSGVTVAGEQGVFIVAPWFQAGEYAVAILSEGQITEMRPAGNHEVPFHSVRGVHPGLTPVRPHNPLATDDRDAWPRSAIRLRFERKRGFQTPEYFGKILSTLV